VGVQVQRPADHDGRGEHDQAARYPGHPGHPVEREQQDKGDGTDGDGGPARAAQVATRWTNWLIASPDPFFRPKSLGS
jgi:hypothetical protein